MEGPRFRIFPSRYLSSLIPSGLDSQGQFRVFSLVPQKSSSQWPRNGNHANKYMLLYKNAQRSLNHHYAGSCPLVSILVKFGIDARYRAETFFTLQAAGGA